mgnify:FL=1|jgi:ribosomal-protein-alanine N-acetyltransferase
MTAEAIYRPIPVITTDRLVLRAFALEDAPKVQQLAGAREIAAVTSHIEHPYPDGAAALWIATHAPEFDRGDGIVEAITRRATGELIGAIGLTVEPPHKRAELGYWIGVPYWGQGYCTEAARALLDYGFGVMGLRRIYARHYGSNPASGRVMQKLGMRPEGVLREHDLKWGRIEDDVYYGLLRRDWEQSTA